MHVLAAMQVTGKAGGIQVPDAALAGVFNMGGAAVANFVSILEPLRANVIPAMRELGRRLCRCRAHASARATGEGGIDDAFRALVLHEEGGKVVPRIESVDEERLPPGEVTVAVECSTLNYKDGMILQGIGRLVRNYPHVPGVDFAGTVERSRFAGVQAGRSGNSDRLAGRRDAMGRLRREGARPGLLSGAPAGRAQRPPGDGDRHRRVHGDAGGHRFGAARAQARRGRCAGYRRRRRGRQRRGGAPVAARASGRRVDRPTRAARLSRPSSARPI